MSLQVDAELSEEYDALHVGIILYDPNTGKVLDSNPKLESVFGYSTEQLRGMPGSRYSANTFSGTVDELTERIARTADGDPQQFRWRVKRADGELIWVRFHLSRIELDGAVRVLAEVHDITGYYTAKRRVGLLSRLMRHNVRNDVNVIAGTAQQIATITQDQQVHEHAEKILSRAMDFAETTESIKQIDKATSPSGSGDATERAATAIARVVEELQDEYPAAEIRVDENRPMVITADNAVEYALRQAVENAIVHSDDPSPTVELSVDSSPNTGRVEIRVADANAPIPDGELDALDEFAETTSTHHGSGVGLFVMKWCIESLGGELKVETRASQGNLVYFYLPPKDESGEPEPNHGGR